MCGKLLDTSATTSMSNRIAPGILACLNSSSASRPTPTIASLSLCSELLQLVHLSKEQCHCQMQGRRSTAWQTPCFGVCTAFDNAEFSMIPCRAMHDHCSLAVGYIVMAEWHTDCPAPAMLLGLRNIHDLRQSGLSVQVSDCNCACLAVCARRSAPITARYQDASNTFTSLRSRLAASHAGETRSLVSSEVGFGAAVSMTFRW